MGGSGFGGYGDISGHMRQHSRISNDLDIIFEQFKIDELNKTQSNSKQQGSKKMAAKEKPMPVFRSVTREQSAFYKINRPSVAMNEGKYDINYKLVTEKEIQADIGYHPKVEPRPKNNNFPNCLLNGFEKVAVNIATRGGTASHQRFLLSSLVMLVQKQLKSMRGMQAATIGNGLEHLARDSPDGFSERPPERAAGLPVGNKETTQVTTLCGLSQFIERTVSQVVEPPELHCFIVGKSAGRAGTVLTPSEMYRDTVQSLGTKNIGSSSTLCGVNCS